MPYLKTLLLSLLFLFVSAAHAQPEPFKYLEFIWDSTPDDQEGDNYYDISNSAPTGGNAFIKTMRIYEDQNKTKLIREVDIKNHAKFPDNYQFIHKIKQGELFVSKAEGNATHYNKNSTVYYSDYNSEDWLNAASEAFKSRNLNHYVGGSYPTGGPDNMRIDNYKNNIGDDSHYTRHKLSYYKGFKVGINGGGYVIVSERGGNNTYVLEARDKDGKRLKTLFIQEGNDMHCSQATNGTPYVPSGRMQNMHQEICVAVYPLQALADPGQTISDIILWSGTADHPDGKVMLIHDLQAPALCYDYTVRQNGLTPRFQR